MKESILRPEHYYAEVFKSRQGGTIKLTAEDFTDFGDTTQTIDIWGRVGDGNPIRLNKDPDKSMKKYGGVVGYENSPARGILYHITVGEYFAFNMRAREYFRKIEN